jgi:hypothetical protein
VTTVTLESALRSSVMLLVSERRRLELELTELEDRMATARTTAEARTIEERKATARATLAEIERQEAAERAEAKAAEERAQRALLKGRAKVLVEHEERRLRAVADAEQALLAFTAACNTMLTEGEAARQVGLEIAAARGLRLHGAMSAVEAKAAESRIGYAVSAHLSQINVPGRLAGGRIGSLALPGATMHARGSWVATERGKVAADLAELLNVEKEGAN